MQIKLDVTHASEEHSLNDVKALLLCDGRFRHCLRAFRLRDLDGRHGWSIDFRSCTFVRWAYANE
jgi:hypothetical protein